MEMNPFVLDFEEGEPFADALLVQYVPTGKILFPDGRLGPGFFVEAPEAPGPGWEKARLTTADKAVDGWAAREIALAPVALRFRWVQGQPGAWAPLERYEEGARGHAQVLGVLRTKEPDRTKKLDQAQTDQKASDQTKEKPDQTQGPQPLWAVITAKGLASRDLVRAFRAHKALLARRRLAPFAAWMTLRVGEGRRLPAGVAHSLARKEEELVQLPEELGWAIRERYPEAIRWRAAWGGENGEAVPAEDPETREAPEAPEAAAPRTTPAVPAAPEPTPEPVQDATAPAPEAAPAVAGESLELEQEVNLAFLLAQGGPLALARLRRAFPDLPENAREAVRELARRKPQAEFWKKVPQAMDLFLAWADLFPLLPRIAPVRLRALKEQLSLGPAHGEDTENPTALAALAALRWLFRPAERKNLESLFRDLTGPEQ
jgi:hypothetical protein